MSTGRVRTNAPAVTVSVEIGIRRGAGLAEALLALVLVTVIVGASASALGRAARTTAIASRRAELLDAGRTASAVLRSDLTMLTSADFTLSGDSVRLRVFRGLAVVCDTVAGAALVRYRGARLPAPEKDSVLLIGHANEWPASLESSVDAAGACAAGVDERILRWQLDPPRDPQRVALLFETGTYLLQDRALRYRRGAGGRQPLTADVFTPDFGLSREDALITIALPVDASFSGAAIPATVRIALPNLVALSWSDPR